MHIGLRDIIEIIWQNFRDWLRKLWAPSWWCPICGGHPVNGWYEHEVLEDGRTKRIVSRHTICEHGHIWKMSEGW